MGRQSLGESLPRTRERPMGPILQGRHPRVVHIPRPDHQRGEEIASRLSSISRNSRQASVESSQGSAEPGWSVTEVQRGKAAVRPRLKDLGTTGSRSPRRYGDRALSPPRSVLRPRRHMPLCPPPRFIPRRGNGALTAGGRRNRRVAQVPATVTPRCHHTSPAAACRPACSPPGLRLPADCPQSASLGQVRLIPRGSNDVRTRKMGVSMGVNEAQNGLVKGSFKLETVAL